jgi:hypothetical protein
MSKLTVLAAFATLTLAGAASAELLTFDHLKGLDDNSIPNGTGGFDWSVGFFWLAGASRGTTGYDYGMANPPNFAFNATGNAVSFGRSTPFELDSFYLTGAWRNGLKVKVIGKLNGVPVDSTTFTVSATRPTLETLDWDVNEVIFTSFGGVDAGFDGGIDGNQFVLDNLTTSAIPESSTNLVSFSGIPEASTWALMLLGFAGLGYAGFRKARREPVGLDLA